VGWERQGLGRRCESVVIAGVGRWCGNADGELKVLGLKGVGFACGFL
jgi:hypothetical protein